MKKGFSKNEYSEGVKIHGLIKNFGKILFLDQKLWKLVGLGIEENLFFHMVATLEICLGRLVNVKIAVRHYHPATPVCHFVIPAPVNATPWAGCNLILIICYLAQKKKGTNCILDNI